MQNNAQRGETPIRTEELPSVPAGVDLVTLPNGLTVIVREDHSAPVVAAQAWCRAGSVDEGKWTGAGLSHVLEHMLFKGTTTRGAGRIDQEVQAAGGYMNAFTSFDRTVYWINVPNTGSEVAVDILCDIMQHATLPEAEFVKELDVIRREMDMGQDDPERRSSRRLFEVAYTRSPYRHPIIGHLGVFNRLTRKDVLDYYEEKYAPNNIFFTVVGDVKSSDVIAQITKSFENSQAKAINPSVLPKEPIQAAPREIIEEAPIELGYVHYCWHTPELRHADTPLLDILSTLLGAGRSSRLYREIRERQGLAVSVESWTYNPGDEGLFGISAVVEGGKFEEAREAILRELDRILTAPPTEAELAKAIKQFTAGTLATRKTMQGQAQDMGGSWLAAQDLCFSERYLQTVRSATPAELLRAAKAHLRVPNRTCYALLPTGCAPKRVHVAGSHVETPVRLVTLENGLRVLLKENHRLPFVDFRMAIAGGVLAEDASNNGLGYLSARTLLQGTARRTAEQIAVEIESLGGHIDTFSGNNSFGINLEVLRDDFGTGMDVLGDVLRNPAFSTEALEHEREMQLAGIRSQRDHLLQSGAKILRRGLYGPRAYGLDLLGEEETLAKFTREDLAKFHSHWANPKNAVLAIYGDIESEKALDGIRNVLGDWRATTAPLPWAVAGTTEPGDAPAGPKRFLETRDKKQAVVLLGFPTVSLHHPDRYALEMVQEACSDLGSRLFLRIRDELGLAYYVGAQNVSGPIPGYFIFYAGTEPDSAQKVEEEFLSEIGKLRKAGLGEEELKRSKAKILGQKKIARQDLGGQAQATALDELYGLGYANQDAEDAQYEAVSIEDTRRVAERYFTVETSVLTVVRPPLAPPAAS